MYKKNKYYTIPVSINSSDIESSRIPYCLFNLVGLSVKKLDL